MKKNGFTLLELLVSITIFAVVLTVLGQLTSTTLRSWRRISDRQTQFVEAKIAFDSLQDRLSRAEINPYWGFEFGNGTNQSPTAYKKLSDLHFVSGRSDELIDQNYFGHAVFFHGAFGATQDDDAEKLGSLVNSWGYYIEFGNTNDADVLNGLNVEDRYRFRLMELQVDAENVRTFETREEDVKELDLNEYEDRNSLYQWFRKPIEDDNQAYILAENVIALIISPLPRNVEGVPYVEESLAPDYLYDTRLGQYNPTAADITEHQLPPILRTTLVVISEASATRLANENGSSPPNLGIGNLFDSLSDYDRDIEELRETLIDQDIDFRIFTSTIKMRNSKWTEK